MRGRGSGAIVVLSRRSATYRGVLRSGSHCIRGANQNPGAVPAPGRDGSVLAAVGPRRGAMNRDPMYWVRLIIYVLVAIILLVLLLFLLGVL